MKDENKTKKQLITELIELRQQVAGQIDITDRLSTEQAGKQAEEDLKATNQQLLEQTQELSRMATVVMDSNDAVLIQDLEGNISAWNAGATKMYGYSAQEAIKMNVADLVPIAYKAEALDFIVSLKKGELVESLETKRETKDGKLVDVWMVVTKLIDEDGKLIGAATTERDITERKQVEEELAEHKKNLETLIDKKTSALTSANINLERSNKELEQFAYVASHDLQEPLRMISSYTQLLARRYQDKLDQDANDFIGFAVDGSNRMQTMINDLLDYSRVGSRGDPFKLILCETVLGAALDNLELVIADSGVVITYDPLPKVMADGSQLIQLFQNLFENAIKFHGNEPPKIHVSVQKKKAEYVFSVKDNGIGIDPKYHDRIFVIFQRLQSKEKYSGSGIGLSICKKIVERHGGKIWFESEPGQGTTFYFTLPK